MREILFRGKRTDNGEWVYGLLGRYNDYHECANIIDEFECLVPVKTGTVGQYTGLKDKNSKMIFEGDILESRYDEKHLEDKCCEVVLWYDNSWCIQEDGCADPDHLSEDDMLKYSEVIGNIHDNGELLEV